MYRARRLEIEDRFGYVPAPDVEAGQYLIDITFRLGPIRNEMPICEADLVAWERRRGIELEPWEADIVVDMAQAYMAEAHAAKHVGALSPWLPGQKAYQMAMDMKHREAEDARRKAAEKHDKEKQPDGNRKRRRNPPPG